MLDNSNNCFWLENVGNLVSSGCFIPKPIDSYEEQMNSVSRFVVLIFIFFFFFKSPKYAICVSFVLQIVIGITYYMGKICFHKVIKEPYGNVVSAQEPRQEIPRHTAINDLVLTPTYQQTRSLNPKLPSTGSLIINDGASNPQLIDGRQSSFWEYGNVPIEETVSNNQKLVGGANPKTLVQPVIPNPAFDSQVWQPNDFVVPSGINDQKRQELYSNGYISTADTVVVEDTIEPYQKQNNNRYQRIPITDVKFDRMSNNNYTTTSDDMINFGCGYQPLNLESNVPSNFMASTCQTKPNMKEYNKNLYSIPLQPGLYTKSQVNQPDASMSNLGISFNQQFLPTTLKNEKQYQTFLELDPYQVKPIKENYATPSDPFRRDIYDPRTTGYGTSYRSYVDPVTGQPRYYYRDIDQQNQNGYVTRNNIDFTQFGTSTGVYPFHNPLEGNALHKHVDNTYTDSQIGYRSELQQRLLHKNNAREWQQRIAPIRTNVQTKGFMGTSSARNYAGPRGG